MKQALQPLSPVLALVSFGAAFAMLNAPNLESTS
jgi:hypothetical protein